MSALEAQIAASGEAPLTSALDFTLPASSTAIVDRKQHCRAYPTSASTLTYNGTRTVRIRLGGDDFVDPTSVRLMFTLENLDQGTKTLKPLGGPWCCWAQVFERSGGVEITNLPQYGRFHEQFGWKHLTRLEQFGEPAITGFHSSVVASDKNFQPSVLYIPSGGKIQVMTKLYTSLLSQSKYLPLRYMPIEYEFFLAAPEDWLDLSDADHNSNAYAVSDVQILYDASVLDSAVQDSFYSSLLRNAVLSMPILNVYQVVQPVSGSTFSFTTTRAFSRLAQLWISYRAPNGARATSFICPGTLPGCAGNTHVSNTATPSFRLAIGPHNWPNPQPTSVFNGSELFYQFQKTLGHVPNINRQMFQDNCFTVVFDLRKNVQDITSCLSTRTGDLCRIDCFNMSNLQAGAEIYLTMVSFGIVACRESGVSLLT